MLSGRYWLSDMAVGLGYQGYQGGEQCYQGVGSLRSGLSGSRRVDSNSLSCLSGTCVPGWRWVLPRQ